MDSTTGDVKGDAGCCVLEDSVAEQHSVARCNSPVFAAVLVPLKAETLPGIEPEAFEFVAGPIE